MADITNDIPSAFLQGVGVPMLCAHPDHLWTGQVTATEAGPRPGNAVPQQATDLALEVTGEQDAGGDLHTRVLRGGDPALTGGAGIGWREGDSGDYHGWEPPRALTGWEALIWSDAAPNVTSPHLSRLVSDDVVCVYQQTVGGLKRVYVRTKRPEGEWSAGTLLYTAPSGVDNLHPFSLAMPNGDALVGYLVHSDDGNEAQVQIQRSTDDGATWAIASAFALETPIDTSGTAGAGVAGYAVTRLRAAVAAGQVALIAAVIANNTDLTYRDTYLQYASISEGLRYRLIEEGADSDAHYLGFPEIVSHDGLTFSLIFAGGNVTAGGPGVNGQFFLRVLESAYQGINAAWGAGDTSVLSTLEYTLLSGGLLTEGDCAAWVDEDGIIYVAGRAFSGGAATGVCVISRSGDGGASWEGMGESNVSGTRTGLWWRGDADTYPKNLSGCSQAGRALIAHNWSANPGNEDASLAVAYLGGWTTQCLPGQDFFQVDARRAGWEGGVLPIELPGNIGYAKTTSGTATEDLVAGTDSKGSIRITTTAGQLFYTDTPTGTPEEGLCSEFAVHVNSGGDLTANDLAIHAQLADGTNDVNVILRFSRTADTVTMRVVDANNSGAQIGSDVTHDAADDVPLLLRFGLALKADASAGEFACWTGDYTPHASARTWTAGPASLALVNETASPAAGNTLEFGALVTGTVDFELKRAGWVTDQYVGPVGWSAGQSNPGDLYPRPLGPKAVYVAGGTKVRGVAGPGALGDEFRIQTRHDYELDRIFPTVSSSPRRRWRSLGDDPAVQVPQQEIPLYVDTGLTNTANSQPLTPVLAFYFGGCNFRTGELFGYNANTSTWVSLGAFDLAEGLSGLGYLRVGQTVDPNAVEPGLNLSLNELAGGHFSFNTTTKRRVKRHSGGQWNPGGHRVVSVLEDIDGTEPSTGAVGAFVPSQAVVVANITTTQTFAAYKVRIDAQHTPDGYIEAGCIIPMEVHVTTPGPSHGWQRSRSRFSSRNSAADGTTRSRARAKRPSAQSFSVAWPEPMWSGAVGRGQTPDTVKLYTGADSIPVGSWGAAGRTAEGLLSLLDERDTPVLYLHRLPIQGDSQIQVLNRLGDFVYGWMGDTVSEVNTYEVPGDDTTRLMTVSSIPFTEQR